MHLRASPVVLAFTVGNRFNGFFRVAFAVRYVYLRDWQGGLLLRCPLEWTLPQRDVCGPMFDCVPSLASAVFRACYEIDRTALNGNPGECGLCGRVWSPDQAVLARLRSRGATSWRCYFFSQEMPSLSRSDFLFSL